MLRHRDIQLERCTLKSKTSYKQQYKYTFVYTYKYTFVYIYMPVSKVLHYFLGKHYAIGARPFLKAIIFTLVYGTKSIVINSNFQLAPVSLAFLLIKYTCYFSLFCMERYYLDKTLHIFFHMYEIRRDHSRD